MSGEILKTSLNIGLDSFVYTIVLPVVQQVLDWSVID
ncbi:hypothetical protein BN2127_JRS4_01083 [Bacillus cereus]|nr:hypothetical protein BN2127_JRS4_01083 [Bacillus cereus]